MAAPYPTQPPLSPGGHSPQTPLQMGQTGRLYNYLITIDSANFNANNYVENNDPSNTAPNRGQYLVINTTISYVGKHNGVVGADLDLGIKGANWVEYLDSECTARIDNDPLTSAVLSSQATERVSWCLDVPPSALPAYYVFVRSSRDNLDIGRHLYWTI